MAGITEHGIRYPDGASKAKNLGPELETFAKDVDKHIDDRTSAAGLQGLVEDLVPPLVNDLVPPLVEDELNDASIARRTDPAYPWMTVGDPLVFWKDQNGFGTFLEARRSDGAPTPQSATLIARVLTELGFNLTGGGSTDPGSPSDLAGPIVCAGDSLTANDNWVQVLADDTFINTVDLGQAGQSSTEVAFRLGALPVKMTVSGNTIPASGSVDVIALDPDATWRTTSVQWYVKGWLAGVYGTYWFRSASNLTPRFVRDEAGDSVPCPAGTTFVVAPDVPHRTGVGFERMPLIYWSGRNNIDNSAGIQRDDTAVMSHFTGRKMILAVTNGTSETSNTQNYAKIRAINTWRADNWPTQFWDVREWLVHKAIYAMGLTPTSEDLAAMSLDAPPPQIMSDDIHFNPACSTALGHEIAFQMRKRGL
ncbi:hypothetical protein GCM10010922_01460 [Microbacterium sorbitolivorans]|uniref:Uncharacterized protein n=1 Tax=Microbacterium sorbitolivorans TaxID=1867410 RepID=A0A367Y767_9MICO|nr:hypothetical protein [Microbacterium sorbitolivorans]RCK61667.1 hypothetical protein DTO57_03305 [Microbacterium sorbitolivorans]GGF30216.1 hypothetical protein GCM10010922_01460 [Microbacterium sorbitolivorans]